MKKKITFSLAAAGAVGIAGFVFASWQLQPMADQKIREALNALGFDTSRLYEPYLSWQKLSYENVAFDKDSISTIKKIDVSYSPVSLLLFGKLDSITFEEAAITGDWLSGLTFSGWKMPSDLSILAKLPVKRLSLEKANFSFLTEKYGGISVIIDMEGEIKNGSLDIESHISSSQKFISFVASATGVIGHGYSNIEAQIEEGKFEIPGGLLKASRGNGSLTFTKDKGESQKILSELQAGGLTVLGMPWQNASISIESSSEASNIVAEAKSIGIEGIELSLNFQKEAEKPVTATGSITAEKGGDLAAYLNEQKTLAIPSNDMSTIQNAENVTIDFETNNLDQENKTLSYTIGTGENEPGPTHEISFK